MNTLYYGDNLDILKEHIKDESIDLIYLDPPFQSGKNYNQIFQPQAGNIKGATAQIKAFEDTWIWGEEAEQEYTGLITGTLTTKHPGQKLIDLMRAMRGYLTECPLLAYLCMMAPRLVEMRRALKETGSIYLHCDPTASHYLKLVMDAVFKPENFRNEITWKRNFTKKGSQHEMTRYANNADILLFYTKGGKYTFITPRFFLPANELEDIYNKLDEKGRRFKSEPIELPAMMARNNLVFEYRGYTPKFGWMMNKEKLEELDCAEKLYFTKNGKPRRKNFLSDYDGSEIDNLWLDIHPLGQSQAESLGYPTQKPEALLERIIKASSKEEDTVLDPFCGCGTAVAVAERLNRKWIGIDITYLAIDVIKKRFEKNHIKENKHFKVYGDPKDVYSARQLAEQNFSQFEVWAVTQINGTPTGKTGDKGVDGVINFIDNTKKDKVGKGIISVKAGENVNPGMVRDLKGTIRSQHADFGILITKEKFTRGMIEEAIKDGSFNYCYWEGAITEKIPKIQLLNIEDLFTIPIPVKLPPGIMPPYHKPDIKKEVKIKELF